MFLSYFLFNRWPKFYQKIIVKNKEKATAEKAKAKETPSTTTESDATDAIPIDDETV